MTLRSKKEVVEAYKDKYSKATKSEKREILSKLEEITRLHRKSLSRALCRTAPKARRRKRGKSPGRPRVYVNVIVELEQVWKASNFLCGKRLRAALPTLAQRATASRLSPPVLRWKPALLHALGRRRLYLPALVSESQSPRGNAHELSSFHQTYLDV